MTARCGEVGGRCESLDDLPVVSSEHDYDHYQAQRVVTVSGIGKDQETGEETNLVDFQLVDFDLPLTDHNPTLEQVNMLSNTHWLKPRGFQAFGRSAITINGSYEIYAFKGSKDRYIAENNVCSAETDQYVNPHPIKISIDEATAFINHFSHLLNEHTVCQQTLDRKAGEGNIGAYNLPASLLTIREIIRDLENEDVVINGLSDASRNAILEYFQESVNKAEAEEGVLETSIWTQPLLVIVITLSTIAAGVGVGLAVKSLAETRAMRKEMKEGTKYEGKPLEDFGRDMVADVRTNPEQVMSYDLSLHQHAIEQIRLALASGKSAVLIGEHGIGKTVTWEIFVHMVATGQIPELKGATLIKLDIPKMVAGTSRRGDFEARLSAFLDEVERRRAAGENLIIWCDELHRLTSAGRADGIQGGAQDMKENLARRRLVIVGADTAEEYERHIRSDRALASRFIEIRLDEPPAERMPEILRPQANQLQKKHNVIITDEAIRTIAKYCDTYIPEHNFPRKASDHLELISARVRLLSGLPAEQTIAITPAHIHQYFENHLQMTLPKSNEMTPVDTRTHIKTTLEDPAFVKRFAKETGLSEFESRRLLREFAPVLERQLPTLWLEMTEVERASIYSARVGDHISEKFIHDKALNLAERTGRVMRATRGFVDPRFEAEEDRRGPRDRKQGGKRRHHDVRRGMR